MAKNGGKGKVHAAHKRSALIYKAQNKLAINRARRAAKYKKQLAKDKLKKPKVERGTKRYERRQVRMLKTSCPKHGMSFHMSGLGQCQLCIDAYKYNVRADKHNGLFARRSKEMHV